MIQVSEAFRTAIRNGAPQRALLRFNNATFGNDDISITGGGIRLTEIINGDTNLHYGLCPSARLEVSLINHDNLLEQFDFGEFTAQIGVLTTTETVQNSSDVAVTTGLGSVFSIGTDGQLYANGNVANMQISAPLKLLVIQDGILYIFGSGRAWTRGRIGADGVTLTPTTAPSLTINELSWRKIESLMTRKVGLRVTNNALVECRVGKEYTYELAPLGVFIAPKPSVLRKAVVELEAEDRMQLFDTELSDVNFSYPATLQRMYYTLCNAVGVTYTAQNIPNGGLTLNRKPDLFDGATKRDLLGWIAEASATFARFNRLGQMELVRFEDTGVTYDEHDYISAVPSTYEVKPFAKLHIRNADSNIEQVVGDGENAYLIQDNPFLKPQALSVQSRDASAMADSTDPATVILDALSEVGTYSPVAADTFADWTMQAGDVVTIKSGTDSYKTPLYTLNMTWTGSPRVTMESTGSEKPEPISKFERRRFAGGRSAARAQAENEEFKTWAEVHIEEAEANIKLLTGSVTTSTGEYINVEVELDGLKGVVSQKAEASVVTEQGNLITAAQQEINALNAKIVQKADASVVTEQGERLTSAQQEINGLKGAISSKAEQSDVTGLTTVVNELRADTGRIENYVYVYDDNGNLVSSVQAALDGKASTAELTANYVTINALETTVSGLLKVDQLRTAIADLDSVTIQMLELVDLYAYDGHAEKFSVDSLSTKEVLTDSLQINNGGEILIEGVPFTPSDYLKTSDLPSKLSGYATKSWVIDKGYVTGADITTGVTTKSLYIPTDGKITIPEGADLSLFGYTPRWNQMSFVKSVSMTPQMRYLNLMLADGSTTGPMDIVSSISFSSSNDTITYLYRGS